MLKIEQLDVKERSGRYLLKDISMEIPAGRVIGLTGKSGSGKTTLLRSILGMLHTSCHIDAGKILLDDIDLSHLSRKSHRELCGKKLGFIPQNPMTAFDSRLKIGYQMRETFVNRLHLNTSEATDLAKEKLVSVNLKDTDRILGAYPSELSGGMLQRVAAAILLGMSPDYVLADEPTAALDEENRDLLLLIMQEQMKDKGILFVSHDEASVKQYSDRIIEMKDGCIIKDTLIKKTEIYPQENHANNKPRHFPILKLTIQSFLSSRKRFFQMSFSLSIALLCLMMTFTFTFSFRNTIYQYLSSLIPQKSITYKLRNDDPLSLTHFNEASYHYLNLDDYDLMGISHNSQRYQKNEVLFISDDSSYTTHYIYGRAPQNNDEIAVPLSTARKLAQKNKVNTLLNTTWTIYYKHQLKIKGKEVKIVGISPQTYNYDAFYMYEYANYHWITSIFNQTPTARYGMLKYKEDKSIIDSLKKNYPEYEFKAMGESTQKTFNQNMNRIQMVLVVFSILTILSSIFMIMEIMILHAMHLKKDHAIMKAYGEKKIHIFKMSFYQCLILHSYSYVTASLILLGIMKIMNQIIPQITDFPMHLTFQPLIMLILWIGSFLLVCFSTLFSILYIIKLNPSRILKMR